MKVLHAGNLANVGYLVVKILRQAGVNAELLMRKYPHLTEDPKSLDPELETQGYPDWIKCWDNKSRKWKSEVINTMKDKQYDLIHAYVELPIFALFSRRPFVAHSLGSDVWWLAFKNNIKGILLRRAYHAAKAFIYSLPDQNALLPKLKIKKSIFLPIPPPYNKFKSMHIDRSELQDKIVLFHPTNQYYEWKGNDKFLHAFVRLCKERNDVFLILVERGQDIEKTKIILDTPVVRDKVRFLPGPLKQNDLLFYYNFSDIIIDQFKVGAIGVIGQESMSCEKPLLAHINEELYNKLYGEIPPLVNAKDEDSIYFGLTRLLESESERKEIGRRARQWVLKHHNAELFVMRAKKIYEGILEGEDVTEIAASIQKMTA